MAGYLPHGGARPTDQSSGSVNILLSGPNGANPMQFECPVNPSEVVVERPSRQTVTQTLTGAYQDHLGSGLTQVQIRGHTGWRQLKSSFSDGFVAITALRALLYEYDQRVAANDPATIELRLLLDVPSGWEHFLVSKDTFRTSRSRTEPLLFRYDISFTVLRDELLGKAADPSPPFVITFSDTPPPPIGGDTIQAGDILVIGGGGNGSGNGDGTGDDTPPVVAPSVHTIKDDPPIFYGEVPDPNFDTFVYSPDLWTSITTISQLATSWYGSQGFTVTDLLWQGIAKDNSFVLGPITTGSTPLPQYQPGTQVNAPLTLRIRRLDATLWNNSVYNLARWQAGLQEPSAPDRRLDVFGDLFGGLKTFVSQAVEGDRRLFNQLGEFIDNLPDDSRLEPAVQRVFGNY